MGVKNPAVKYDEEENDEGEQEMLRWKRRRGRIMRK